MNWDSMEHKDKASIVCSYTEYNIYQIKGQSFNLLV